MIPWENESLLETVRRCVSEGLLRTLAALDNENRIDFDFNETVVDLSNVFVFGSWLHGCGRFPTSDIDVLAVISDRARVPQFEGVCKLTTWLNLRSFTSSSSTSSSVSPLSSVNCSEMQSSQSSVDDTKMPGDTLHRIEVEVNCVHEQWFRASLRRHTMTSILCLLSPPEFVLCRGPPDEFVQELGPSESIVRAQHGTIVVQKPIWRRSVLQEGGHSLAKSRRLFLAGDRAKGLKNLIHGIRFLRLAEQIALHHHVVDWGCTNDLQKAVLARWGTAEGQWPQPTPDDEMSNRCDWDEIEVLYRPLLSGLMRQISREVCSPVEPDFDVLQVDAAASLRNLGRAKGSQNGDLDEAATFADEVSCNNEHTIGGATRDDSSPAIFRWLKSPSAIRNDPRISIVALRRELAIICDHNVNESELLLFRTARGFSPDHPVCDAAWHGLLLSTEEKRIVAWPGQRWAVGTENSSAAVRSLDWKRACAFKLHDGILVTLYYNSGSNGRSQTPDFEERIEDRRNGWRLMTRLASDARTDSLLIGRRHIASYEDAIQLHGTVRRDLFVLQESFDASTIKLTSSSRLSEPSVQSTTDRNALTQSTVAELFWHAFDKAACRIPSAREFCYTFKLFGGQATMIRGTNPTDDCKIEFISARECGGCGRSLSSAKPIAARAEDWSRVTRHVLAAEKHHIAQKFHWPLPQRLSIDVSPFSRAKAEELAAAQPLSESSGVVMIDDGGHHVCFPSPAYAALKSLISANGPRWTQGPDATAKRALDVAKCEALIDPELVLLHDAFFPQLSVIMKTARTSLHNAALTILKFFHAITGNPDFAQLAKAHFGVHDVLFQLQSGRIQPNVNGVLMHLAVRPSSQLPKILNAASRLT